MSGKSDLDLLTPLDQCGLQPYFSNRVQLAEVIEWVLSQTGPADIAISTFSTSEEFLRRLARLKELGYVCGCSLFCDIRAARKTVALYRFMKSVFDWVGLCENHSKVVLISNESHSVSIVTSQNQTRGDRFEAGVITSDHQTFCRLMLGFKTMSQRSVTIDDLHPRPY